MMKPFRFIFSTLILILVITSLNLAQAQGPEDSLNRFFNQVSSLKTDFTQVVIDENGKHLETSEGELTIKRPGQFVWNYQAPLPQKIISNGDKIWVYDEDLEQVTIRSYDSTLANSPAELLAGKANVIDFYDVLVAKPDGEEETDEPLEWIKLQPKDPDSQFTDVWIGFANQQLRKIYLHDSFERQTRLSFSDLNENAQTSDSDFDFKVPDGVDVIDQSTF